MGSARRSRSRSRFLGLTGNVFCRIADDNAFVDTNEMEITTHLSFDSVWAQHALEVEADIELFFERKETAEPSVDNSVQASPIYVTPEELKDLIPTYEKYLSEIKNTNATKETKCQEKTPFG